MPRIYKKSDKPRQKRQHNVVPKKEETKGYTSVNGFVFSDRVEDWKSKRPGTNLF